jgi:hypothetical protein
MVSIHQSFHVTFEPANSNAATTTNNGYAASHGATNTKVAVIYALPTFHEEVTSVMACILNDLGYYVVVYVGNGVVIGKFRVADLFLDIILTTEFDPEVQL